MDLFIIISLTLLGLLGIFTSVYLYIKLKNPHTEEPEVLDLLDGLHNSIINLEKTINKSIKDIKGEL